MTHPNPIYLEKFGIRRYESLDNTRIFQNTEDLRATMRCHATIRSHEGAIRVSKRVRYEIVRFIEASLHLLTRRSIEKTFHARALYRCVIACVDIEDMPIASRGNCASNGMVAHVVCITDRHKYCKTSDPIVSHDTWICFSHSSLDVFKHTQWTKRMQIHWRRASNAKHEHNYRSASDINYYVNYYAAMLSYVNI